ncbi:transient receptor potential cation channel subfamily M member-like 2 [Penaeus japonicus]|uniref:transient receptor potential cation channel subfamily M member-like 2 n=1 Tax=Penaeus japonicus TaxID=27405 RepID=UPI001C71080E|nr:transient receptor potential cation channel subfamily M member-like 2 [Penaeus japonicus]
MEPQRPQLVISVTGGAKNFRLDGKKNEIFSAGLIKAVKSTDAWILTGGGHVGVTRSVGHAVNQGQYITKVKRKTFSQERDHMVRGIRCIGVVSWGYTKDRDLLVCPDPSDFPTVKYKVTATKFHEPVSLNGDHTHFLLVDDGSRNHYSGSDDFRTRLEEAIQEEEPKGLGVPVVLLLLEGGMSALEKCAMALSRDIPVVVVAGTGRAADLLAYAVSLTVRTPRGEHVLRKGHEAQLMNRISLLMPQLHNKKYLHEDCLGRLLECCRKTNMITIFDINSNEGLDKYILYALMTCRQRSQSSRQDQLGLALLWNRPDIAETQIFPAESNWNLGALEDLMTTALLEEKVEFVKLFVMNGLVMEDYLTVGTLRSLYNQACVPNSHLSRLLQRSSNSWNHTLIHVHNLLQAMMKKHNDKNYLIDTPENIANNPNISSKTFEDPYLELMLWAVFSRRSNLARFLWERCDSPLCSAVVASCMYQALWKSLGKKNTDIRQEYQRQKKVFQGLAEELLNVCYQEDPINAMGLIERRNPKWGQLDCLELAYIANDLVFISSPCSQATVELNWRRGMTKAPYSAVIVANMFPFLIFWSKIFQFQKLGDNGGELTAWQKLIVFYKSPISKFYAHTSTFVIFLLLYSYVVMFDFKYEMSVSEIIVVTWIAATAVEKISEIGTEQSATSLDKLKDWSSSVWSRFDLMAILLASIALVLRLIRRTFRWGRVFYAVNTTVFYCRLFRMYHVNYHLGPKLVIFYRMITEVLVFMALLVVFILGYGIASQSLLHPSHYTLTFNITEVGSIIESVILTPYWQMYGELLLDEIVANDHETCHEKSCQAVDSCLDPSQNCLQDCVCENPTDYKWVVKLMLFFYLIIGNIMLLNLLIAIFTYVFEEVQQNSMEIWKFEMYRLIREYEKKPILVLPFVMLQHFWHFIKFVWKSCCAKNEEEAIEYESDAMVTLRLIEKEATQSYLATVYALEENSLERRVKRMSDKIDRVSKYIDQKEEMEEIEEDMEWIIGKAEELQGMQKNKDGVGGSKSPLLPQVSPLKKNTPLPPRKSPSYQRKQREVRERDDDTDFEENEDVLGEEISDNEIESELAHLFNKVDSVIPNLTSRTNTPLVGTRRLNEVQRISERMDSLEMKLNAFQTNVTQALDKILNVFDKDAKQ